MSRTRNYNPKKRKAFSIIENANKRPRLFEENIDVEGPQHALRGGVLDPNTVTIDYSAKLGEGFYAEVYGCAIQGYAQKFAIKKINMDTQSLEKCGQELSFLQKMSGIPTIIQLHGYYISDITFYNIIIEFAAKGSLDKNVVQLNECQQYKIMQQVVHGVMHIHSRGIIHCDLKMENILIDENGDAKVCDFGLAKQEESPGAPLVTAKGTPRYAAPELLLLMMGSLDWEYRNITNTRDTDIFSLSLILWAIDTKQLMPYPQYIESNYDFLFDLVADIAKSGFKSEISKTCPKGIAKWITLGLSVNPKERPTAVNMYDGLLKETPTIGKSTP